LDKHEKVPVKIRQDISQIKRFEFISICGKVKISQGHKGQNISGGDLLNFHEKGGEVRRKE
jgi:hypothetical protein